MLIILLAVVITAAVYYLAILPRLNGSTAALLDEGSTLQEKIQTLQDISYHFGETGKKRKQLEKKLSSKNDNITSLVQKWGGDAGITSHIAYTRRTQTNVQNKYVRINTDVKINGAPIQSLLEFIAKIESSNDLIYINYINISKGVKSRKTYDALIKIHSYIAK